jgi:hypothetical protein
MKRPCSCDRFEPGRPYDPARDCRPCWLYGNDPRYRELWDGPAPDSPRLDRSAWPLPARALARLAAAGERGLGDTAARVLAKFGGEAMKRFYKKLFGRDCGCGSRQAALNRLYPYPRGE